MTVTNGLHDTTDLETHPTNSDHVIVTYSILLNERTVFNSPYYTPLFRKADWARFETIVHEELNGIPIASLEEVTTTTQIDEMINSFTNAVSKGQKMSVPMVRKTSYVFHQSLKKK